MRVLVAGIGNVFLGDDGFGVEVVRRLSERSLPPWAEVADFGIRGYDLAYALLEDYAYAVLVDAVPRGEPPGTVFVLEPDLEALPGPASPDGHAMGPDRVLALVRELGGRPPRLFLVGCEPASLGGEEGAMGLSPPVAAAVEEALAAIERLLGELAGRTEAGSRA
ncbi:MAG TPA: hydrogenase maturation protease [Candidatus Dormibacteraeota bacterium]|nr:hydrogenase maturation protease [Candidatus Dormibacteraeota bacterium]